MHECSSISPTGFCIADGYRFLYSCVEDDYQWISIIMRGWQDVVLILCQQVLLCSCVSSKCGVEFSKLGSFYLPTWSIRASRASKTSSGGSISRIYTRHKNIMLS